MISPPHCMHACTYCMYIPHCTACHTHCMYTHTVCTCHTVLHATLYVCMHCSTLCHIINQLGWYSFLNHMLGLQRSWSCLATYLRTYCICSYISLVLQTANVSLACWFTNIPMYRLKQSHLSHECLFFHTRGLPRSVLHTNTLKVAWNVIAICLKHQNVFE